MEQNDLILTKEKEVSVLMLIGSVALPNLPYNKKLCEKWGITKEQFNYLKLHYKHNPKQALLDLAEKCKEVFKKEE